MYSVRIGGDQSGYCIFLNFSWWLLMKKKFPFTLVELLVVVSLIAVIAGGLSVSYSGVREKATKQMMLKEMHMVRDAFKLFYADNYKQVQTLKGLSGSGSFLNFFEDYGLWGLLQRKVDSIEFDELNPLFGTGWCGPYLAHAGRKIKEIAGTAFPQPTDLNGHSYALLNVSFTDSKGKRYKRLLLVATVDGRLDLTADSAERRIVPATGAVSFESADSNDLTVELLNLDPQI